MSGYWTIVVDPGDDVTVSQVKHRLELIEGVEVVAISLDPDDAVHMLGPRPGELTIDLTVPFR